MEAPWRGRLPGEFRLSAAAASESLIRNELLDGPLHRLRSAVRPYSRLKIGDDAGSWSGYRESNPGIQLGRLLLYH